MKSKFYILASILAVLCLICSCGGGGGSSDGDAQKTVAVSFAVNTDAASRAITVTNPNVLNGATYQYTATPNFTTSDFGENPKGKQTTFADLTMDATNTSTNTLYFTQGNWTFDVRVIIKGANYATDSTDFTLLYSGSATQYINATDNNVEVTVTRQIDRGNGTLDVNAVTSVAASSADDLVITYGAIGSAMSELATIDSAEVAAGRSSFTNRSISVPAGIYVMTFTVKDKYGTPVGATTKTVEIVKGVTTPVTGTIESGKWVSTSITVKGVKTITCEMTVTKTTFTKASENVAITYKGWISENGDATDDDVTFYFSDGMSAPVELDTFEGSESTEHTYNWVLTSVAPGYWYPTIIASDEAGTLITNDNNANKITIQ